MPMANHHYTIVEAVALLQTGGRARRPVWEEGHYIEYRNPNPVVGPTAKMAPPLPGLFVLTREDILSCDWEVEP